MIQHICNCNLRRKENDEEKILSEIFAQNGLKLMKDINSQIQNGQAIPIRKTTKDTHTHTHTPCIQIPVNMEFHILQK